MAGRASRKAKPHALHLGRDSRKELMLGPSVGAASDQVEFFELYQCALGALLGQPRASGDLTESELLEDGLIRTSGHHQRRGNGLLIGTEVTAGDRRSVRRFRSAELDACFGFRAKIPAQNKKAPTGIEPV
jgi:hypothetical protein